MEAIKSDTINNLMKENQYFLKFHDLKEDDLIILKIGSENLV